MKGPRKMFKEVVKVVEKKRIAEEEKRKKEQKEQEQIEEDRQTMCRKELKRFQYRYKNATNTGELKQLQNDVEKKRYEQEREKNCKGTKKEGGMWINTELTNLIAKIKKAIEIVEKTRSKETCDDEEKLKNLKNEIKKMEKTPLMQNILEDLELICTQSEETEQKSVIQKATTAVAEVNRQHDDTPIQFFNNIPTNNGLADLDGEDETTWWLGHYDNIKNIPGKFEIDENKYEIRQASSDEVKILTKGTLLQTFIDDQNLIKTDDEKERRKWVNNIPWRTGKGATDFVEELKNNKIVLFFIMPKGMDVAVEKTKNPIDKMKAFFKFNFLGLCTLSHKVDFLKDNDSFVQKRVIVLHDFAKTPEVSEDDSEEEEEENKFSAASFLQKVLELYRKDNGVKTNFIRTDIWKYGNEKELEKRERFFINKLKFKCVHNCKNHTMYKGTDNNNNVVQKPRMQQLKHKQRKLQTNSEVYLYRQIEQDVSNLKTFDKEGELWESMINDINGINDSRGYWDNEYLMETFINLFTGTYFRNSFKTLMEEKDKSRKYKIYFSKENRLYARTNGIWRKMCIVGKSNYTANQCVKRHKTIHQIFQFLIESQDSIFGQALNFINTQKIYGNKQWDNYKVKEFVPYDFRKVEKRPEAMKDIRIEFETSNLRSVAIDQGFNPFTSDGNLKKKGAFKQSDLFKLQPIDLNSIWQTEEQLKIPEPITFGLASRKAQQFSVFE